MPKVVSAITRTRLQRVFGMESLEPSSFNSTLVRAEFESAYICVHSFSIHRLTQTRLLIFKAKCPCHDHGCRVGVRNSTKYDRKTALRSGTELGKISLTQVPACPWTLHSSITICRCLFCSVHTRESVT